MCRSARQGGRRCSGSAGRIRALGTARKRVQRARNRLNQAKRAGDAEQIRTASERLNQAQQQLADTHAEHPHPQNASAQQGHDTPMNDTTNSSNDDNDQQASQQHQDHDAPRAVNIAADGATVGLQTTGTVDGASITINTGRGAARRSGDSTSSSGAGPGFDINSVINAAMRAADQATQHAADAADQARSDWGHDTTGHNTSTTIHHPDGSTSVVNVATGPVGIQTGHRGGRR